MNTEKPTKIKKLFDMEFTRCLHRSYKKRLDHNFNLLKQ